MENNLKKSISSKKQNKNCVWKWKTTSIFLKKEDELIFFIMEDDLKKHIMQPKPNKSKSKNNGCGTAPGNLVLN